MNYIRYYAELLFLAGSLFFCSSNTVSALPTIELVGNSNMIVCQMQAAQQLGYNSFDISSFNKNAYDKLNTIDRTNLNITGLPHAQLAHFVGNSLKSFYISAEDEHALNPQSLELIAGLSTNPMLVAGFLGMSLHDIVYLSSVWEIDYKNYKLPLPKLYLEKKRIPCTSLLRLLVRPPHKKAVGLVDNAINAFQNAVEFFTRKNIQLLIALPIGESHYLNKSIPLKKIAEKYQCHAYLILIKFLESKGINVIPVAASSMNIVHEQITKLASLELTHEDLEHLEKAITETITEKSPSNKDLIFLQHYLMPLVTDIPNIKHMQISRL